MTDTERAARADAVATSATACGPDLTGRKQLTANVLSSWLGYVVFIVGGFVMPRLIDRQVGQAALGVWDFAWSLVTYLQLAQLGIGASGGRFIAKYRATGEIAGMNRAASSVMVIQLAAAAVAATVTLALAAAVPWVSGHRLGDQVATTRWVIVFLGTAVAVDMALDVYRGVLTGCHRWDLHNAIDAGSHAAAVAGMILVLLLGGGLPHVAFVYMSGVVVMQVARYSAAHRVCPELRLRFADFDRQEAASMWEFGFKAAMHGVSRLVLLQANGILVVWALGPAALAVYARPGALMRHVESLVNKLAFVLTPTASSMQAAGRDRELRALLFTAGRYAVALALPVLLFLGILGGDVLRLWMGRRYDEGGVLTILAVGYLMALSQQPAATILRGIDRHGRVGVVGMISAVVGIGMGVLFISRWKLGLYGAALAVALPLATGNGIFIAVYVCRTLKISVAEYVRQVFWRPALCCAPFAAALVAIRVVAPDKPEEALALGSAAGAFLLVPLYWRYILPQSIKEKVQQSLVRSGSAAPTSDG